MRVALIAALDEGGVIGARNRLPWHLPADLKHFRRLTTGKPIVMGRRTHESIGRPLPDRHNIVVSRDPAYRAEGCSVATSLEAALALCVGKSEVMVIGGAALYRAALDYAERLYLTRIHHRFTGDVRFPELEPGQWVEVEREEHAADERNPYRYSFTVNERVGHAPRRRR